jgi:outer membrane protein assembly factor BamA
MTKLHYLISVFFLLTVMVGSSQSYKLQFVGVDDENISQKAGLEEQFSSRTEASAYLSRLPFLLQAKGFVTASIDSMNMDSTFGKVYLFLGRQYNWEGISLQGQEDELLTPVNWDPKSYKGNTDFNTVKAWQQKILDLLENNGYPFAKVYLDNISFHNEMIRGILKVERGPLYKIDSIRVYGDAKINNSFLQRFLDIPNGSIYNRSKLNSISKKLSGLTYLEEEKPSDLSMLGTGSVLNLYLKPRKSSQVNALIGFLPNSSQLTGSKKLLLTVDANILLKNSFGSGETIGLIWQQLQPQSPKLNILYDKPFVFNSPFGINFLFDMYKRDSSYLNLNFNLGTTFTIDEKRSGTIFFQRRQSIVSNFNSQQIIQQKKLPEEIDVSSVNLGLSFLYNSTDYRFNPRKGNEFSFTASTGIKNIRKNQEILDLKDPSDPNYNFDQLYDSLDLKSYQFRIVFSGSHFFPLGGQSTIRTVLNGGVYQSESFFRNEVFQIGGFKLLRGFDEESEFVSRYLVGTLEYRYLVERNSNFFVFTDGGYGKHISGDAPDHFYFSTGIGFSFETKAGIFNLAWAVGKRDDLEFNLRQSKVHIGFASYF